MEKIIKLGDRVRVSDPCYGTDCWCAGTVTNIKPGDYKVIADHEGVRVKRLSIVHSDYSIENLSFTEEANFEVGVDSGMAGFYDEEYYNKYHSSQNDKEHCNEFWLYNLYDLTNGSERLAVKDEKCVVSESGYGDGSYACYIARNEDGKVIGLTIEFIFDYDDEDYEDEEDNELKIVVAVNDDSALYLYIKDDKVEYVVANPDGPVKVGQDVTSWSNGHYFDNLIQAVQYFTNTTLATAYNYKTVKGDVIKNESISGKKS